MCTTDQDIGTTSLFFWSVSDVAVSNNIVSELPYTNSGDGTGADLESFSERISFRGNRKQPRHARSRSRDGVRVQGRKPGESSQRM